MRMIIAVVVASLALAGGANAQEMVNIPGDSPTSGLRVNCPDGGGFIAGISNSSRSEREMRESPLRDWFPNGSAVLTWDGREEQYTFEAYPYPSSLLLTRNFSFIENLISHNSLTVEAEFYIEDVNVVLRPQQGETHRRGPVLPLKNTFDLRGSQAALITLSCVALERARQKCRETFSDDFVLQNVCIEQQEEAFRNRR